MKTRIYSMKHGPRSEKSIFLTYSNVPMGKNDIGDFQRLQALRVKILKACSHSNEGHVPSAFSILDILYSLYILLPKTSNINLENPLMENHDEQILASEIERDLADVRFIYLSDRCIYTRDILLP
jgi:hypothetical protein